MFQGVAREKELDEVIDVHSRCEPGRLNKLAKLTKFNKQEIRMLYQGFKQECPCGEVNEDTFKSIFSQFFPQGDAADYAHYVFKTFKKANGNKELLNFEDFLVMLSQISRGSCEEKLRWIFKLYDSNGDGYISKSEMLQIVKSIYEMLGDCTKPLVNSASAQEHVDRMFSTIDSDMDGMISFEDLSNWCQSDSLRAQNLLMFDTVFM